MRIEQVRVFPLTGGTVDGGWPEGHEPEDHLHALVRIDTDEGLSGWGSCFTSGALVSAALDVLNPMLIGQPDCEPERVTEGLRQSCFWQGRGGAIEHAISGIDIALWDLMGQLCGQPVSRLLGGNYRDRIKPYASILFDEPDVLRERLKGVLARGFRAIKLGWRPFGRRDSAFDEQLVQVARETVGDSVDLMVDAGGSEQFWPHGRPWARRTADMLAGFDIAWFEEPLPPDDLEGYIELTRNSRVPIAGGEVLTRRQAFQPWIERRAVDILQPDCTKCGGISESRKIAWAAYDHNIQYVPHGWNTALGLAADLQLVASVPVARFVEYLTPCAYIEELVTEPFVVDDDGFLEIPASPGLGINVSEDGLRQFLAD